MLQRVAYTRQVDLIVDLDLRAVAVWATETMTIRSLQENFPSEAATTEIYRLMLSNTFLRAELCNRYAAEHDVAGHALG
jgi:hypothetical protein